MSSNAVPTSRLLQIVQDTLTQGSAQANTISLARSRRAATKQLAFFVHELVAQNDNDPERKQQVGQPLQSSQPDRVVIKDCSHERRPSTIP